MFGRKKRREEERLRSALFACQANDTDLWIRFGYALYGWDRKRGYRLWEEWIRSSGMFDSKTLKQRWKQDIIRSKAPRDPVTIASIFYVAREDYDWEE